jgi:tetratricopeptide (TPR) repeat protein
MAKQRRTKPETPAPRRGAWWPGAVALALVIVAGGAALAWRGRAADPEALVPLPPPTLVASTGGVTRADFAGAESCAGCHATQYAAWKGSTHGRAGGAPSADLVISRFDGTPIRFKDATVTPTARGGVYSFTVAQDGRPPRVLRVDGVVGGGHMVGGGTQGFVTRFPDGTLRFLPFDFARRENVWFCNTNSRIDAGWIPITAEIPLAACGDWPPSRVLGDEPRFANCQQCHGSGITLAYDTVARRYETSVRSLAIDCESCHGPGRRHVALAGSGAIDTATDVAIGVLSTAGKDASMQTCFQCHALKNELTPGYLPGKSLVEHYALKFPMLGDRPLHPDGRVRTFAYQANQLYSACYLDGGMTCASCHDPHGQGYVDVSGRPIPGRVSNAQCTGCHASKAEPLQAHTRHAATSAGSNCVSCHMPYLQEHEIGRTLRYARSDHTIPVPRPALDQALGVVGACQSCHGDRDPAALQRSIDGWFGAGKPLRPILAAAVDASQSTDPQALVRLVLATDERHPMAQFAAVARLLESYLAPDMPALDARVVRRLSELAQHVDVDVASIALASLHLARGDDPAVRRVLAERLRAAGARESAVRKRWTLALGYIGDSYQALGRRDEAMAAYRKALDVLPGEPRVLASLGRAQHAAGRLPDAVASFRASLARDPSQSLTLVNMGLALEDAGDTTAAVASFARATAINPGEALGHFNLANVHLVRGRPDLAIPLYQRTVAIDPTIGLAHFYLARAYLLTNDVARARAAARHGLEFDTENPEGRRVLEYLAQLGGRGAPSGQTP